VSPPTFKRGVLEIHDSYLVLPAHLRRLVHSPTLALIQTRDQTRIPLLGPTPIRPDPRVRAQGLAPVRLIIKGDAEEVFRRWIVAIVGVECRIGENATQAKVHQAMTGGDDSHRAPRDFQVDRLLFIDPLHLFHNCGFTKPLLSL